MATDHNNAAASGLAVGPHGRWPLPWVKPWLEALRPYERSHALLLHVAPGMGSLQLAVALGQARLCEAPQDGLPCGACNACRAINQHLHADLLLVMPEALRRAWVWPMLGDKADKGDGDTEGKRKPSEQIRIEEMRQAIDWSSRSASQARGRVLLLHPATAMNAVTANALLKTLEEPPKGLRLVLTAGDPQRLLPTVRSRCQTVRLPPPSTAELVQWLEGQGVESAETLLRAAGAMPLRALEWSRGGLRAEQWHALPDAIARGQVEALTNWPLDQAIDVLLRLCHDTMRRAVGASASYFADATIPMTAAPARLAAWHGRLLRVARHADHPWQAPLLLEALVDDAQDALRAKA